MPEQLLTLEEVAKSLGCTRRYVETLVSTDDLPSYKLGRLRRVREEDLSSWVAGKRDGGTP